MKTMKENHNEVKNESASEQVESPKKTLKETCCGHHSSPCCCGFNFGKLLLGLLLIAFGLLFFAKALGLLSFNWHLSWSYLWPLLIVFFGLSLLNRGHWVATLIGVFVTLFVLAAVGMITWRAVNQKSPDFFGERWFDSSSFCPIGGINN